MPKVIAKSKRRSILAPYRESSTRNRDINRDNTSLSMAAPSENLDPASIRSNLSTNSTANTPNILTASREEVISLLQEIRSHQCTKDDLKSYSNAINTKFKEVDKQLETNTENIESMDNRLAALEIDAATARFETELGKQRLLRNNLSIVGVPRTSEECLETIATEIFRSLGCESAKTTIDSCYRINNNAECNIFIAKLKAYELKHHILAAKMDKRLSLKDIDRLCSSDQPIYINNHLTPFFGKLLADGRRAVKEKKIHSCWMSSNGPLLKLEVNGKQMNFYSAEHLATIIEDDQTSKVAVTKTSKRKRQDGAIAGKAPKSKK